MRIACVFVPQLALQAVLRRTPEAQGGAVALLGGDGTPAAEKSSRRASGRPRVLQLSASARRAGVRIGMTGAQASAVSPGLHLLTATAADLEAAYAALADVGFAFAPRVEHTDAGGVIAAGDDGRIFFETDDLGQLYPQGERAIIQAVQAAAARIGLGARVAIADAKGVARAVTQAHELAVVPAGAAAARAFVAPIPVEMLTADATLAASFRRWGTRTAGDIARLPPDAVALRMGPDGARVCRLARGEDDEPFAPRWPADALEEAIEVDYPIAELEPLTFVLRGLLDRALARLTCRSLACAGLTLRLNLDPRGLDVRTVVIAAPTRDVATLLQLARLDLARRPPSGPVVGARIIALPARVRATQLDMLRPSGPAPDRLAATIARLAALVGPENVGAPAIVDTWREEAAAVAPFALSGPGTGAGASAGLSATEPALAIRRRRPPEEIEVLIGRDGPTAFRGRETTARVLIAAGPYHLSGEWWRNDSEGGGWSRAYWDMHASDGAVYRVHQDRRDGRWYLDGYYD
jgi:protein ImuB